jgi:hypothetical protein
VTDNELYFENAEVAADYCKLMRFSTIGELTPINPEEIPLYTNDITTIITTDIIDELTAGYNDNDEADGLTDIDDFNATYYNIVKEGLRL